MTQNEMRLIKALISQAKETAMWHKETEGMSSDEAFSFAEKNWEGYLSEVSKDALFDLDPNVRR
jgi:hypothetical protein